MNNKEIYYYELLQLIQEGKNPKEVWYNHTKFTWDTVRHCYQSDDNRNLIRARYINVYGDKIGSYEEIERILPRFKVNYTEDVLDSAEKNYLRKVIKPFSDKVSGIAKLEDDGIYFLAIYLGYNEMPILLPAFYKSSGMYNGMKPDTVYTKEGLKL